MTTRSAKRPPALGRAFWVACWLLLAIAAGVIGVRAWKAARGDSGVVPIVSIDGSTHVTPGEKARFRVLARDQRSGRALAGEVVELYLARDPDVFLGKARSDDAGQA